MLGTPPKRWYTSRYIRYGTLEASKAPVMAARITPEDFGNALLTEASRYEVLADRSNVALTVKLRKEDGRRSKGEENIPDDIGVDG